MEVDIKWGRHIGGGTFGNVYEVEVNGIPGHFACKQAKLGSSEDDIRRFKREVRMQSQLAHHHIMPILASDLEGDPPCFFMPLASHSLREVIAQYPSNHDEAVGVFLKVATAVAYAHQEGVIHRDLKPENILFVGDEPRVSDFGLGRELDRQTTTITQTNATMGSVPYMSPEQSKDARDVGASSDIYTLGKILYELLTGELPFPTMDTTLLQGRFRFVVEKATRPRISDRYFSVEEMINDIRILTEKAELLKPVLDCAQSLVAEASSEADPEKVRRALQFLKMHPDDSELHHKIVAKLPTTLLELASVHCNDDLCDVIDAFCANAANPMPFSFVDVVANLLRAAFQACARSFTKKNIASRLLGVGYSHNRYHVRTVVKALLENLTDDEEIMIFRDALAEYPDDCHSWYEECFSSRTPELIRQTLRIKQPETISRN